ncbi:MAG TPA: cytochrome b/b6 domain-containing protein, partial [Zeimonas sp.]
FAHVAALVGSSLIRGRNRMLPMITGRIDGHGPDLVRNRRWLAALLLVASLAFVAGQWMQWPNGLLPTSVWRELSAIVDAAFS